MKKYIVLLGVLLLGVLPLLAQSEFPRGEVFGGYSYLNVDTSGLTSRQSLNGWNAQANVNFNKWLGLTGDFGGYYGSPFHVSVHDYSFLFGPTVTYRTEHFAPFFHALFGGNHIDASLEGSSGGDTAFAMAFGGGVDVPVKGSFGIRVAQVDWLRTQHFNTNQNNIRLSTGIIFNFGK
jgi:Outer membrane protein beta-barrel domain